MSEFIFSQDDPNSTLSINATEGGLYERFTNGEQWRQDWQSGATDWKVENAALHHTGTTFSSITFQPTASFSNYGVRVSLDPADTIQQPLGLQMGDQLTVQWAPSQGFSLTIGANQPVESSATGAMPKEWLLVAADESVLFYANGRQIFAEQISEPISGVLQLSTGDEVAFKDVLVFKSPQLLITYTDGTDKERQVQVLDGSHCLVAEKIYDELGRPAVGTKTARFEDRLGYRSQFVDSIDWSSGVLAGEVADYYPQDEGFPYNRTVIEPSSLARPIKTGSPGQEFAIRGEENIHIVTAEYRANHNGDFAGDPYPEGQYFVEKRRDANGTQVDTLKDQQGRTLAKKAGPIDADGEYQTIQHEYDAAGNVVTAMLPNQFVPPEESSADAWQMSMSYNFFGQMISCTTPNSGTEHYIYDKAGRPRFMVDAVGLEQNIILYKKYDVMGRLIEEGWLSQAWGGNESLLQDKADNEPSWPSQSGSYTRSKQLLYDGDGSNPYLIGRLYKVQSYNQGGDEPDVEEEYEYDRFGNIISKTLMVAGHDTLSVRYEYDNQGNVTKLTYPNGSPLTEVLYTYNQLGQTIKVGTLDNPARFASYTYNANGSIASVALNNNSSPQITRSLEYNSPGWPERIGHEFAADQSLVIEQSLGYTGDGYEGAAYYNGNIAKASIQYGEWDSGRQNYDYRYQYDKLGRLQVAENSQDAQASLGVGAPTTYDANGNIKQLKKGDTTNQYSYVKETDKVEQVDGSDQNQVYSYDANGYVKSASHRQISNINYDPASKLTTQVELNEGASIISFKYGADNQRVLKTGNTDKLYVHGLNDYPLFETDVGGEQVQYIYGPDGLLAMIKGSTHYYVLKDHQGSTRVVLDEAGTVIAAFDYMPFGDLMQTPFGTPDIISYRYTGQEYDAELGLYNYRARFYDSSLGRFYAIDPVREFTSPYLYSGNDPINIVDPDGELLIALLVAAAIGATAGAIAGGVKASQEGASGWEAVAYVFGGAAIGAVGGALAGAAGAAVAAVAAPVAAAAGLGALGTLAVETGITAVGASVIGSGVSSAEGVANAALANALGADDSLSEAAKSGAITGAWTGAAGEVFSGAAKGVSKGAKATSVDSLTTSAHRKKVKKLQPKHGSNAVKVARVSQFRKAKRFYKIGDATESYVEPYVGNFGTYYGIGTSISDAVNTPTSSPDSSTTDSASLSGGVGVQLSQMTRPTSWSDSLNMSPWQS